MAHTVRSDCNGIAVVELRRGKVNALNEGVLAELDRTFDDLADDPDVRGCILTGHGSFFSFGFDVPGFMDYTKEAFAAWLTQFTRFYTKLFVFPKPLVAALNGHTIAGGCMLAIACDRRVMSDGRGRISLNEITFGASLLAGSVAMLRAAVGHRNAERIVLTGAMFDPAQALELGLVDAVVPPADLSSRAVAAVGELMHGDPVAFGSIKRLLREPIAARMRRREPDSIREFTDIWYTDAMRRRLAKIEIRG